MTTEIPGTDEPRAEFHAARFEAMAAERLGERRFASLVQSAMSPRWGRKTTRTITSHRTPKTAGQSVN